MAKFYNVYAISVKEIYKEKFQMFVCYHIVCIWRKYFLSDCTMKVSILYMTLEVTKIKKQDTPCRESGTIYMTPCTRQALVLPAILQMLSN